MKLLGKIRDRRVCTSELLKNAASRGVGECGERGIEGGVRMMNHVVQYTRGPAESDDPVATLQSHADDDSLCETVPLSGRRRYSESQA